MKERKINLLEIACPQENCLFKANNRTEMLSHLEYNCSYFRIYKLNYHELKTHYNQTVLKLRKEKVTKMGLSSLIFNQAITPLEIFQSINESLKEDQEFVHQSAIEIQQCIFPKKHDCNRRGFNNFALSQTINLPSDQVDYSSSTIKSGLFTGICVQSLSNMSGKSIYQVSNTSGGSTQSCSSYGQISRYKSYLALKCMDHSIRLISLNEITTSNYTISNLYQSPQSEAFRVPNSSSSKSIKKSISIKDPLDPITSESSKVLSNGDDLSPKKNCSSKMPQEPKIHNLEFHTNSITEIKKVKIKQQTYLSSCSYDRWCIFWCVNRMNIFRKFYYGSWCLSCTVVTERSESMKDYVYCCGGFKPGESIRVYDVDSEKEIKEKSITIESGVNPLIIEAFYEESSGTTYVIVGADKGLFIYDTVTKTKAMGYETKSLITSVRTSNSIRIKNIYFIEYSGIFRILDYTAKKILKETKVGYTSVDLIQWDDSSYIVCGDCRDNSYKLIYEGKSNLVNTFPNMHSKVVLSTCVMDNHFFGKTLVTFGADNKIKLYNQISTYK